MHISTGRQIFYIGGLIFFINSTGTKACVTAADLIDSDEKLNCFTRPLSSCDIKISVMYSRGCSIYEHAAVRVFLRLTTWTSGLLSDLVTVDAD